MAATVTPTQPETGAARLAFEGDRALSDRDVADVGTRAAVLPGYIGVERTGSRTLDVLYDPQATRPELIRLGVESPFLQLVGRTGGLAGLRAALAPARLAALWQTLRTADNRVAMLLVAITLVGTIVGYAVQRSAGMEWAAPIWLVTYLAGGWFATIHAARSIRAGALDVDLLMIVAALGAASVGAFWEGGVLLFLFSLGNVLEEFALGRTQASIRALMDLRPETVRVREADGSERELPAEEVAIGMLAVVRPGDRIPVDGTVAAGAASVNEAAITGESLPVPKGPGDEVFAGSIDDDGYLEVRVTRTSDETFLSRVIRLVTEAREERAPAQRVIDRYVTPYVIGVFILSAVVFVALVVFFDHTASEAFLQAMTVLVVASPCAIVISIPATMLSAMANAAHHGVLAKGSGALFELGRVRTIAFDKTGTLTRGAPEVVEVLPADGFGREELLRAVAAVEVPSSHPLAQSVVRFCEREGVAIPACEEFLNVAGHGVEGSVDGRRVLVGSAAYLRDAGVEPPSGLTASLAGETLLYAAIDGRPAGVIGAADEVRPEAAEAVRRLDALGVRTTMLSGDRPEVAERVRLLIGLADAEGGLKPHEKVDRVKALAAGGSVAMVGDGVNDAPALASATVGIAMGAGGTDTALETADVVLVRDRLLDVPYVVQLARRARRVVHQNIGFAGGVIVILLIAATFVGIPLPLGVVAHEGSTIIVTLNGLRLLRGLR